jgi:hypothetical protein
MVDIRDFIREFAAGQEAIVLDALTQAGRPLRDALIAMDLGWFPAQAWKVLARLEARGLVRPVNEYRVTWELVPESAEGSCGTTATPASCSLPGSSSSGPGADGAAGTSDGSGEEGPDELGTPGAIEYGGT